MTTNYNKPVFLAGEILEEVENGSLTLLKQNSLEALENLSLLVMREIEVLKTAEASFSFENSSPKISFEDAVENFEIGLIRNALVHSNGSQTKAAELLGIKLTTLNAKIKRYGISLGLYKEQERQS
jgi:transcriptional regulator with PAS, ATPase and Fis domain